MSMEHIKSSGVEVNPQEYCPFTDQERKALIKDGAAILRLTGETIESQLKARKLFGFVTRGGNRLLKTPSIRTEVAIYPSPNRFFIPNSGNKDLRTQERLAKKDGQELRKKLGLKDDSLTVIIPSQASTLTELIFKYLDETTKKGKGVWLFGPDYGCLFGRTKHIVDEFGFLVAAVGHVNPDQGVWVGCWDRDAGLDGLRAVRLVVKKESAVVPSLEIRGAVDTPHVT